ncbi:MarP family serine protease [Glaciihabitans sp. dw_435]|uniref:MarP family serine protease n=1 Tax=Glaciihabitans sp. dw_435 TaxID=2720081 RepID=UPI001BD2D826|nr:MarP family serine protease [Glaciihabitans sp. dw_435]
MSGPLILDVVLVVVLLSYLAYGYRNGFVHALSGIVGIVAGGAIALVVIPLLSTWIPDPTGRTLASIVVAIVLIIAGHSAGVTVGSLLRRGVRRVGLSLLDRLLGAVVSLVVAALVISAIAVSIGSLGVPFLSPLIASSTVLRTIDGLTPTPAKAALAQLRTIATEQGIPAVVGALGGPTTSPELPEASAATPELTRAAASVLRITGNAYACGQSQSGSGFVVAKNRVVTNAHVVAGVDKPVVEVPGGEALQGTIVYFDPIGDLAVIAVTGLSAPSLDLVDSLPVGSVGVTNGYPLGGPFVSTPARVISLASSPVADIYGQNPVPRHIYSLAADIQPGDSGGPLLDTSGDVAGVVFAKNATVGNVGYAIAMDELAPVADEAASLRASVSSGSCIAD